MLPCNMLIKLVGLVQMMDNDMEIIQETHSCRFKTTMWILRDWQRCYCFFKMGTLYRLKNLQWRVTGNIWNTMLDTESDFTILWALWVIRNIWLSLLTFIEVRRIYSETFCKYGRVSTGESREPEVHILDSYN